MDATLTPAIIAAASGLSGALIGGFITLTVANKQAEATQRSQETDARIEFRQRQLGELYGPMYLERRRSQALRSQLPHWEGQ